MSGTELVTNAAADPLRIVLVAPPYFDIPPKGYGGIEAVVAELADALVKRGHDVTVLHERVGQVGDHDLDAPVALGRNVEIGWRDEHDPQRIGGSASVTSSVPLT